MLAESDNSEYKSLIKSNWVSTSFIEARTSTKNFSLSALPNLPSPSAIFDSTEIAALRICVINTNCSILGSLPVSLRPQESISVLLSKLQDPENLPYLPTHLPTDPIDLLENPNFAFSAFKKRSFSK